MNQTNAKVQLSGTNKTVGMGWLPPLPDMRDYTATHEDAQPERNIKLMAEKLGIAGSAATDAAPLPGSIDLRKSCSAIEDQLELGSCTAHAAAGIIEYFERRAFGRHVDASRLFIYKTTRNLLGWTGDTGAYLRTTMAALRLCGAPPEKYWPYTDAQQPGRPHFDEEPTSFVYALADNYEAVSYFTHDSVGTVPTDLLCSVKTWLAAGVPSMFGFAVFDSMDAGNVPGSFPFPCSNDEVIGGHAVVAVGYDDNLKITNTRCGKITTGALLIRNSWGTGWGDKGYGWLPYDYVLQGLADDFWSLLAMNWVDSGNFGLGLDV